MIYPNHETASLSKRQRCRGEYCSSYIWSAQTTPPATNVQEHHHPTPDRPLTPHQAKRRLELQQLCILACSRLFFQPGRVGSMLHAFGTCSYETNLRGERRLSIISFPALPYHSEQIQQCFKDEADNDLSSSSKTPHHPRQIYIRVKSFYFIFTSSPLHRKLSR